MTNCTPTPKTTARPRHRRNVIISSIADEISILYELDLVTKLRHSPRKSELRAALSLAGTNHVHFSKCNRMHPSDSGCSLHTGVVQHVAACCILHRRPYAGFIRSYAAYEGCVRSYCSLHAGTHAACVPP